MKVIVDFICIWACSSSEKRKASKYYKVKNSFQQWHSNHKPSAYEAHESASYGRLGVRIPLLARMFISNSRLLIPHSFPYRSTKPMHTNQPRHNSTSSQYPVLASLFSICFFTWAKIFNIGCFTSQSTLCVTLFHFSPDPRGKLK